MARQNPASPVAVLLLLLPIALLLSPPHVLPAGEQVRPLFQPFPLPKSLSLCGEPMPLENPSVREMLDREFTINVWDQAQVFLWLKRGARYFPYIEKKLAELGMPSDLKYLCVAESSLLTYARSDKGATGLWQFMAQTGMRHGLRKDQTVDERFSFERATDAAFAYLGHLKGLFGSWTLALAGYNCGEGRLLREMKEQRVSDYYRLDLPAETERFIFRIAAIKIILEDPKRYGYQLPQEDLYTPIQCDRVPVSVGAPVHITDLAQALGHDFKTIKELNPEIMGHHLPTGSYVLRVPPGAGPKLSGVLATRAPVSIPAPQRRPAGSHYLVQPGDTLRAIAAKTGVSMETIKELNNISGSTIKIGQKLRLTP